MSRHAGSRWVASIAALFVSTAAMLSALSACSTPADVSGTGGSPTTAAQPAPAPATADQIASAPRCSGPDPDGQGLPCLGPGDPVDVHALTGPTVVSVWASWCGPCRKELPVLQQYADSGGSILGVDVADRSQAAADLLAELDVTFPSVQDPESTTRVALGWVGPPANYVIVDGRVGYRFDTEITSVDQVRRAVSQASGKG